jgi:hypothetical protein
VLGQVKIKAQKANEIMQSHESMLSYKKLIVQGNMQNRNVGLQLHNLCRSSSRWSMGIA